MDQASPIVYRPEIHTEKADIRGRKHIVISLKVSATLSCMRSAGNTAARGTLLSHIYLRAAATFLVELETNLRHSRSLRLYNHGEGVVVNIVT